jgi:type IV secretion system protein TrbL
MEDFSAIDTFLETFTRYIDSGFGLIEGDIASLASILIVIDVTLAAMFWAWGEQEDVLRSLVRKTLHVGAFAFILGQFQPLSEIVFASFAELGLKASDAPFGPADLFRPGLVAAEGVTAARPIFDHISLVAPGFVEVFANLPEVILLFASGLIVIAAFFVLSLQLFILIIEFKLTTLVGFVLIPFAFWKQTTFLAERVLAQVMASGVKVLVVAVIIGIGSGLFGELRTALSADDITIEQALSVVLGALVLAGLALFCPRLATGILSGAPQLSAGSAVRVVRNVSAASAAVGAGAMIGAQGAARMGRAAPGALADITGLTRGAIDAGAEHTGRTGLASAPGNLATGLGHAAAGRARALAGDIAAGFRARSAGSAVAIRAAASHAGSARSDPRDDASPGHIGETSRAGSGLAGETPRPSGDRPTGLAAPSRQLMTRDRAGPSPGPDRKETL